jgi:hypothetical protein
MRPERVSVILLVRFFALVRGLSYLLGQIASGLVSKAAATICSAAHQWVVNTRWKCE